MGTLLSRLEKYFFYLLLFSIPFQTRKILYYSGWRFNEWQSISIYATDLLLVLLFVFWFFNFKLKLNRYDYFLLAFIAISVISVKNSSNYLISWFQWLKLLEFIGFYFYLKNYAIYKFGFTNAIFAVFYGGVFQAAISVIQFLKQSDIGLRYLGESIFNADIKGVAAFYSLYGEKVIRAYGTTPHPNVLSGYLFLAIFCFYLIWLYPHTHLGSAPLSAGFNKSQVSVGVYKKTKYENILFYAHLLITWALFYTFARVAIFALGANYFIRSCLSIFKFKNSLGRNKVLRLAFFTTGLVALFTVLYWPDVISRATISVDEDAVQLRSFYNKESIKILSWTGTGIGDFVNELAVRVPMLPDYLYQPVHNIYLLIYAETGILGILMFILFLVFLILDFVARTKMKRFHHYSLLLLFFSFLFMGLFDHFLWTIQQGRFVFWLVMAAVAVEENEDIT